MSSLVDFHCHLDLYPDFENLILECEQSKIYTLTVTTTPLAWPRNFSLTKNTKYVRAALGLHPQLVGQRSDEINLWEKYFEEARYIGEIGLDASPAYYKTLQHQEIIFDKIIKKCSAEGGRILTVHSVRTIQKVLEILEKHSVLRNNKIVLHWFSGTAAQLQRAVSLGCYFSVNLNMVSKENSLVGLIPKNRLLTETDGPFTQYNNLPQRPMNITDCVSQLARILQMTYEDAKNLIAHNLSELLSLQL